MLSGIVASGTQMGAVSDSRVMARSRWPLPVPRSPSSRTGQGVSAYLGSRARMLVIVG